MIYLEKLLEQLSLADNRPTEELVDLLPKSDVIFIQVEEHTVYLLILPHIMIGCECNLPSEQGSR